MKTLPDTHVREVSCCPSPVTIWQTLLTRLLDQHYGLTLNDTPFADERVIEQHIEAGISLCEAIVLVQQSGQQYLPDFNRRRARTGRLPEIGRASCRERV